MRRRKGRWKRDRECRKGEICKAVWTGAAVFWGEALMIGYEDMEGFEGFSC